MLRSLKDAISAFKPVLADHHGVASFEYVILAACVVAVVASAFGTSTSRSVGSTLSAAVTTVLTALAAAVGG